MGFHFCSKKTPRKKIQKFKLHNRNLHTYQFNFLGQNEDSGVVSQLKKGILWQQRDKIFSRWKERFFVLTKDYLQCFKKGTSRITEMGGFIYGIRLTEVCTIYTKFGHIKIPSIFLVFRDLPYVTYRCIDQ